MSTIATTIAHSAMPHTIDEENQHITTTMELIPGDIEIATLIKKSNGYIISIDADGNPATIFDPSKHGTKFVYDKVGLPEDVHIIATAPGVQQTIKVVIRDNNVGSSSKATMVATFVKKSPEHTTVVKAEQTFDNDDIGGSSESFIEKSSVPSSAVAGSKRPIAAPAVSGPADKKLKKDQLAIVVENRGTVKHGYKKRVINAIFKDLGIDTYYQTHTQPEGKIKKICYVGDGSQKPVIFSTDPEAITHASELQSHDILAEVKKNVSKKFPTVMALPSNYFSNDPDADDDDDVAEM